ncbi:putative F-box protein At3g16210 [Neltuma alba]|uniref:putative F-box protein At3g16210 n=1 Tax=Neltuma alba TaxID=207710 RepID=UPI0010A2BB3E|nr:putative F-box protein At3g16210 [Prosopis alba]
MIMDDRVAPFLPEEIIRNILKRLPVKSLMRFQCVCKHWKNLFKCPSFIADHFHHSSHQNPLLLLQPEREGQYISHLYLLDREMQVHDLSNLFDAMRIIGSCNGLLCVEIDVQGFGFSPMVNDYKIVRTYAEYKDSIYQVEVYSLSTRSWKEVEFDYMAGTRFVNDAITANGSMFGLGY